MCACAIKHMHTGGLQNEKSLETKIVIILNILDNNQTYLKVIIYFKLTSFPTHENVRQYIVYNL